MFEKFRNPNGTYNGAKALSAWTGLSYEEVTWTAKRLKQLMHEDGNTKQEALGIVKEESKSKPWIGSENK
jgi:hypothetical protein